MNVINRSASPDISIFINVLADGGAERAMIRVANGIATRGYAVDMVVATTADRQCAAELASTIRLIELRSFTKLAEPILRIRNWSTRILGGEEPTTPSMAYAGWHTFFALPDLWRYLRSERPRSLLGVLNQANLTALFAHKFSRSDARLALSVRAAVEADYISRRSLRSALWPVVMRIFYPWSGGIVITVARDLAKELATLCRIPPNRVVAIYNPITVRALSENIARDRTCFILAAGRFDRQKDFPTLLRAFARLRAKREVGLVILGEGNLRVELEMLARELGVANDVEMPGFSPHIHDYMRGASLFVLSSRFEGLPSVLIEAMACGTRVVSTDCPFGPAEILEYGKWGRLVPVGDHDALARAMAETLDDPSPPDVRRRAADFSVDRAVDRYLEVLGVKQKRRNGSTLHSIDAS